MSVSPPLASSDLAPATRSDLFVAGATANALNDAVRAGSLVRVRRGSYVSGSDWDMAYAEQRESALAEAALQHAQGPLVFSHTTAAALHGLPLIRHSAQRAHVMVGSESNRGTSRWVLRHRDGWDGGFARVDGFLATTISRTVFDVIRSCGVETAIACADAALRLGGGGDVRALDQAGVDELRDAIMWHVVRASGLRGIRQARMTVALVDPRSESPGESVSRLYLHRLGYEDVRTQVPIAGSDGRTYRVDFAFAGVFGEFDGARKYVDPAMTGGRDSSAVLMDEKRREDAIRSASGRRVIRWTMAELATLETFRRHLRAAGVPRPRRP